MTRTALDDNPEAQTLLEECVGKEWSQNQKDKSPKSKQDDDISSLAEKDRKYWTQCAVLLSLVSVLLQLLIGVTIFVLSMMQRSSGGLGLAINSLLDVLTTVVVIWRYGCEKRQNKKGAEMERLACILISILFIISGIAIEAKACFNLSRKWIPFFKPQVLLPIEITTAIIYGGLTWAKFFLAKKLDSKSLFVDGVNTACGFLMAIMQLVSILVYHEAKLWFLDSLSAIVIALFIFVFGIKLLFSSTKKTEQFKG